MSGQKARQALERFTCFGQHLIRAVRLDRPETPDPLDLGRLQDWKDLVASGFSDRVFCRRHARTREAALSLLYRRGVDRHFSQALPRCRKDRVGYRRDNRGCPTFTHSARGLSTLNNVDFDLRRLVPAQHLVGVKIGLFDPTIFECDLAIERRRRAEDDAALNLRPYSIGVDHSAAVHRAYDAPHTYRAVLRNLNFGNVRHIGSEHELQGDATANPLGQWLSPARFSSGKFKNNFGAG